MILSFPFGVMSALVRPCGSRIHMRHWPHVHGEVQGGEESQAPTKVVWKLLLPCKRRGSRAWTTSPSLPNTNGYPKSRGCWSSSPTLFLLRAKGEHGEHQQAHQAGHTQKTDTSTLTDKRTAWIQAKTNNRPMEKLNFNTPKDIFYRHLS